MSQRVSMNQRGGDQPYRDEADPSSFGRRHGSAAGERVKPRGYTLSCAGRQLRLGPITFWTGMLGLALMALWSAGTATYFVFRDDLLTRLISRQADMQYAYEDRIVELRSQIDRLTSRQLLDQEKVEQRIEQLARRQNTLDARAATFAGTADNSPMGSVRSGARPGMQPVSGTLPAAKPSPLSDAVTPAPGRQSSLQSSEPARDIVPGEVRTLGIPAALARIEESLDRVEARQSAALLAMEDSYDAKARRMRGVLVDLGVDVKKIATSGAPSGVGGPFIPLPTRSEAAGFDRQLNRVQLARAHVDHLSRALTTVPVRQPLAGELETSSGFGVRLDPFMRGPAMHSGLDLRAPPGESVRATASGKVVSAGWSGGYGRMVEIDHGNGFATRYGHLSQILVKEDQAIRPGQIIGRVGSTGRSTGPHLHYETRIDGEAVDPIRFLKAGLRLGERS